MALELVGGAALGAVFGEFLSAVLKVKDKTLQFKPKMTELEQTLRVLAPVIHEIEELNKQLNQPDPSETESIIRLMEEGKNLVSKCSHVGRWNFLKMSRYQKKLLELDNKILRFHILLLQVHMARDVKCIRLNLRKLGRRRYPRHAAYDKKAPAGFVKNSPALLSYLDSFEDSGDDLDEAVNFKPAIEQMEVAKDEAVMFKSTVEHLKATMGSLFSVLHEIDSENNHHGPDQSEIEIIWRLMEEGRRMVRESSNIGRWNFVKKWRYQKKLAKLENKLLRFHSLHLQAHKVRDHETTSDGQTKQENESQD